MIRRPPRSTQSRSSAASDVYKRQNYYRTVHVPMAVKGWNPLSAQIDKGVSGPYEAAVHFVFPTVAAFENAMGMPVTADLMADLPNYTNISAVIQVAEIVEG